MFDKFVNSDLTDIYYISDMLVNVAVVKHIRNIQFKNRRRKMNTANSNVVAFTPAIRPSQIKSQANFMRNLKINGMTMNDYLVILYLEAEGAVSSKDMMLYLENKLTYSASYSMLRKLEVQGILSKEWMADESGQHRNYYAVTNLGKIILAKILA